MPRAEMKFFAYFANDIADIFHVTDGLLHFDIDTVCIFNALATPDKKKANSRNKVVYTFHATKLVSIEIALKYQATKLIYAHLSRLDRAN